MSLLSSTTASIRCLADEEADHNMLQDLQLAAELGKTLLERNKELENIIKLHQSTVEEQAQEIEYMKKQTAALREVNDSRLKIYEQLEVSIQDLERANHRLVIENTSDKKLIKSQCLTIENLETRCDDLQKKIDELNVQRDAILHRQQASTNSTQAQTIIWKGSDTHDGSIPENATPSSPRPYQEVVAETSVRQVGAPTDEEVTELFRQLQESRSQRAREQQKVTEISQQLASLLQENSALEEQLNIWRSKAQEVKNLQDEISALEEVRQGQLCGRCLRGMDSRAQDELSVMLDQEEFDDISMVESFVNVSHRDTEQTTLVQDTNKSKSAGCTENDSNPYKVLVEKYEALLDVQKHSAPRRKNSIPTQCVSLQEELEMSGEFNSFHNPSAEQESVKSAIAGCGRGKSENGGKKAFSATPTDFSEAETSSSGFSDETSNKATQTDGRPGSFLCSIADGEDCKFSIYDDNSPFESRFRKTPEYRQTFGEIFRVLKRAAELKDEGEELPLLNNDSSTGTNGSAQSSAIAAHQQEDVPSETTDDNQSVMSSVISSVVSEPVYRIETPPAQRKETKDDQQKSNNKQQQQQQQNGGTPVAVANKNGKHSVVAATSAASQQNATRLDYLSINVHVRTRSSSKKSAAKKLFNDRPTTPDIIPTTNPKFVPAKSNSGGKRRFRPFTAADHEGAWNGHTQYIYSNRTKDLPSANHGNGRRSNVYARNANSSEQHNNSFFDYGEYKPSTASEDVARLKRLEMSYAEALRMPNKSKVNHHRRS